MLIIIQYTITDLRNFIRNDDLIIPFPSWPSPQDNEFVRAMGQVKRRKLGGINNWIGESYICIAKQAIKINKWYSFSKNKSFKINLKFRRFFFDGYATGKYEIGFVLIPRDSVVELKSIINEILSLEVRIKILNGNERIVEMSKLKNDLKDQYYYSTTRTEYLKNELSESNLNKIKCSSPSFFIEKNILEKVKINYYGDSIYINDVDSNITYYNFNINNINYPTWLLENAQSLLIYNKMIRDIRVVLSRLISNRKTITEILKSIEKGLINPVPFSKESDLLQEYLLDNIKNILNKEKVIKSNDLVCLVRDVEDRLFSGDNSALYEKLKKTINIRPQVLQKIKEFLEFSEILFLNKKHKTEIIMRKNQVTVKDGKNFNINISDGNINQNISKSYNMSDDLVEKVIILIEKLECQISEIEPRVNSELYSQILCKLEFLKSDVQNEMPNSKEIKKKVLSFKDVVKTTGAIGAPLLTIIKEVLELI